jgi:hypothetical protein
MKKFLCGLCAAAGLTVGVAASNAAVVFSDDFESGLGSWTQAPASGNPNITLETDQAVSPTHSAKSVASGSRIYHNLGQEVSNSAGVSATFYIYDDTMTRSFAQVLGYSGAGYTSGTLQNLLAIGKYNTVTMPGEVFAGTKYQARIANGTGMGWFNLNGAGSPNRSTGWHKFTVEVLSDGVTTNWYVDDILSRTIVAPSALPDWDSITLGFGTNSSSNGNTWYDDVSLSTVPEPAACGLLALGLVGAVSRRRR